MKKMFKFVQLIFEAVISCAVIIMLSGITRPVGWGGSGGSDEPPHCQKRSAKISQLIQISRFTYLICN